MKNITKKIAFLLATLLMFISFGCSSAFAASCLFGHSAVATPSVEATCTVNGSYGGSYCSKCNTVLEEATVVPATGHTKSETPTITPATTELDGAYSYACVNCNVIMESGAIPKIDSKSIALSATKFIYSGKDIKPTVTVKDTTGKALVEGQDYDVVYPDSIIMPEKYEVTVIFKGNYSGEQKLSFTIVPKVTTGIKTKTATVNSITLQWTKTAGATGYEVYKYNSSTKKYVKIDTVTTNSYKVTGLKGNTTYKFKVRAYTETADGSILYAANSSVFSTKTTYGVIFTGSSASIYIGGTKQLKATTAPANKKLTWKSSDASIAKVSSSGVVTAVKKGTATITASFKVDGKTYKGTYKITVKKPSIKLSTNNTRMYESDTFIIKATTEPADLKVTWKSSNASVVTVSSTGLVTAKKSGAATLTGSVTYKGKTYKATCKVTVKSIAENLAELKNYILKNGYTNADGEKFIKKVETYYSTTYTTAILYSEKNDYFKFFYDYESRYEEVSVYATLDGTGTNVTFKTYIFELDYWGDPEYSAVTEATLKAADYTERYSIYDSWTSYTFPVSMQTEVKQTRNTHNSMATTKWWLMLYDAIGTGLGGIGFTNYD